MSQFTTADGLIAEAAAEIQKLRDAIGHAVIELGGLCDRATSAESDFADQVSLIVDNLAGSVMP